MKIKATILLFLLVFSNQNLFSQSIASKPISGIVRVKFDSVVVNSLNRENQVQSLNGHLTLGVSAIDNANKVCQVSKMTRVFPYSGKFEAKHRKYDLHLWYDLHFESTATVENVIEIYDNLAHIQIAKPVITYSHDVIMRGESVNDSRFADQWHYDNTGQTRGKVGSDVSLLEAWKTTTGSKDVIVSVHDSGFDLDHPDLKNVIWVNEGEVPNNGIDDDNNGYIDDINGFNFWNLSADVTDYNGHGTHVSGTIAANNDNGIGVSGIAGGTAAKTGVRIMMCRLGDDRGSPYIFNPAPSFVYAADMGSVISQNSWGGGSYEQELVDAINYYVAEAGSSRASLDGGIVIMSAGNSSSSYPDYRSELDMTMMVAATNHNDQKSWYSNYGSWIDISAPGGETDGPDREGVLSTINGGGYAFYQGTSMACPHVSGVAALVLSHKKGIKNTELWDILLESVDSIDQYNTRYQSQLGTGRINAGKAVQGFGTTPDGMLEPIPSSLSEKINYGESQTFDLKLQNTGLSALTYKMKIPEADRDWVSLKDTLDQLLLPGEIVKNQVTLSTKNLEEGKKYFSRVTFTYNNTEKINITN